MRKPWATPPERTLRDPKDHRVWLEYWSDEMLKAIARAIATPNPTTIEDLHLDHAVRCARCAYGRAMKVQPKLKEPTHMTLRDIQHGGYPTSETPIIDMKAARRRASQGAGITRRAERIVEKRSCIPTAAPIKSTQVERTTPDEGARPQPDMPAGPAETTTPALPATTRSPIMTLTLKSLNKRGNQAFYSGLRTVVRIPLTAFVDKTAPQTIEVEGAFAPATTPRAQMTPEERKAARAAQPKLTIAEKIAKREKALEALRAKAAAEQASL